MNLNSNLNINNITSTNMLNSNVVNRNMANMNNINKITKNTIENGVTYIYKENYYNKLNINEEVTNYNKSNEYNIRKQNEPKEVMNKNTNSFEENRKKKEENFKSITHFAKYLFFIAKKIACINNNNSNNQYIDDELQKSLVKHLIYKLNKILSSLINFNVLQYNENENIKQEIEYLCLKNSNITLNKIRIMLKRLDESNINYKYILHILLKLKAYEDENKSSEYINNNTIVSQLNENSNFQNEKKINSLNDDSLSSKKKYVDESLNNINKNVIIDENVNHSNKNTNYINKTNIENKEEYKKLRSENKNKNENDYSLAVQNKKIKNESLSNKENEKKDIYETKNKNENIILHKNNLVNKSLYATIILNNKFHNLDVEENFILRDLIYPLQGINGEYIKFNKKENVFCVYNRKVSIGMYHLINNISNVGILFKKIKKYINVSNNNTKKISIYDDNNSDLSNYEACSDDNNKNNNNYNTYENVENYYESEKLICSVNKNISKDQIIKNKKNASIAKKGSLVIDALYQIIREYINEYYKLLSYIESDINEHIHKNTVYIGVKKLYLLLQESYKILRVLVNVIDESLRNIGCNFLSFLYSKSQTYDYEEQKIYKKILQKCIKPINEILKQWIEKGILKDKYNETFISTNKNVNSEEIWLYKFYLNCNNIPLFLSVRTAKKILLTGKSVYLINFFGNNKNLGDNEFNNTNDSNIINTMNSNKSYMLNQRNGILSNNSTNNIILNRGMKNNNNNNNINDYSSSDEENIMDIFSVNDINIYIDNIDYYIKKISDKKNKKLISLLIKKYDLYDHFKAFRHFLLLVDGDLFETIFDNMKTDLYMNAEELKRHYLNSKLDLCIKSSSIFTSNQNIIKKLIIEKFNIKRGDIGWDVLVFDFLVEKPLDIIFTKKIKNIYKSINVLLIKLKKILCELSNMWYLFTHLFKIINLVYYNSVFTYCNIIRNEMFHFIQNILSYFYYDVIDTNWQEFKKKIFSCNDLDELIQAHYNYITQIQFDLFLGSYNDLIINSANNYSEDESHLNNSLNSGINDFYNSSNDRDISCIYNNNDLNEENINKSNKNNIDNETHNCLNKILDIITRFINLTSALISSVCENYTEIKKLTEERKEEKGNFENDIDYINNYINYNIIGEKTIKDIKMLLKYYRNYIYKFICLLLSENKFLYIYSKNSKRDKLYSLRLLASRLDFNLYYVNISKVIESKNSKLNISKQIKMMNK
ncbi:gamma-tubulin complex component, putative [Plasmodium gallinaceum]|uniref:Gamma-tubulin complex component, putative n=1 Tax=Plasmodium gallinaceum TaxID=5849 RepID=A0A1J1H0T2_PLAGA|nr:gamma-tubulin complex component, putative [Plasmodium gallinaceum]CRG96885.1 gamma-tubulin complex component, putative [Plasmodium gallinaceum]